MTAEAACVTAPRPPSIHEGPGRAPASVPSEAEASNLLRAVFQAFAPRTLAELALFLVGVNLMWVNVLMVRHATVAFRKPEIAVIAFSMAYFLGVSAGYRRSDRLQASTVVRSLPLFLGMQMALIAGMQPVHHFMAGVFRRVGAEGWVDDVGAGLVVFALLAGCVTSVYAVFLPRTIGTDGNGMRRCYSLEVAGSLTGLALVPVLAGLGHSILLAAYLGVAVLLMAVAGASRWTVAVLSVGAAVFVGIQPALDRAGAAWTYRQVYGWNVDAIPFTKFTPYHKIEIVRVGGEPRLLLNGLRQFGGDPKRTYSYFAAAYPARFHESPRVAVLGCGSMATVGRIGETAESIRIVDLDPEVFEASRVYFGRENRLDRLHNWTFTADDAKHWIANATESFDLILHDIPPARSRQVALTYTDEFFRLAKARLSPTGIFSISCLTPVEGESEYGRRMLATLTSVFERCMALERKGSLYFYGGGSALDEPEAAELLARLDPAFRRDVRALTRRDLIALAGTATPITISNVGDLIYE